MFTYCNVYFNLNYCVLYIYIMVRKGRVDEKKCYISIFHIHVKKILHERMGSFLLAVYSIAFDSLTLDRYAAAAALAYLPMPTQYNVACKFFRYTTLVVREFGK